MDSGATSLICNNEEFFKSLSCEKKGKVLFANKSELTYVEGIGSGTFKIVNT